MSLLSDSAIRSTDSQEYLLRETVLRNFAFFVLKTRAYEVNLKCLGGRSGQASLKAVKGTRLHQTRLLLKHLIHVFFDWSSHNLQSVGSTQQDSLEPLKGLLLCNLEAQEGLPAPYTGVKAII